MLRVLFNVAKILADSLRELTRKKDTCSVTEQIDNLAQISYTELTNLSLYFFINKSS